MERPRQLLGIASVGLNADRSFPRDQRGSHDVTVHSVAFQTPEDDITARAGLIDKPQLDAGRLEFFDDFIQGIERSVDDAVVADLSAALGRDGHGDGFLIDAQTDIMHSLAHEWLVPFMEDESGAACAFPMADRYSLRNCAGIKHPVDSFVKP